MRQLLGLLVFSLILLQILSQIAGPLPDDSPLLSERARLEREWDAKLRGALSLLPSATASSGPAPGEIELLENGKRVDQRQLHDLLGREVSKSAFFVYRFYGVESASASALGLDRQHHFVNAYLEGYRPFATDNVFVPLAVLARKKTYMLDHLNHGGDEVWQSSRQAYWFTRGDCEDHAIALADWLIDMGHDARVALGTYQGSGHAWVVLIKDGQEYILEATQKRGVSGLKQYPLAATLTDYVPRYQFNRSHFWATVADLPTQRYQGSHWVEKSRYNRKQQEG